MDVASAATFPLVVPPSLLIDGVAQRGKRLGIGSFGSVYAGTWFGSEVAIKRLHPFWFEETDVEPRNACLQFLDECVKMASIGHPNVVQCFGIAPPLLPEFKSPGIVTELLAYTLYERYRMTEPPLTVRGEVRIASGVAAGLQYLHNRLNLLHRDLNTCNIMLTTDSVKDFVVKITDVGCSKLMDLSGAERKPMSANVGTRAYMAPEALAKSGLRAGCATESALYGKHSDVYSFGVCLLAMCLRREPDAGKSSAEARQDDLHCLDSSHCLFALISSCLSVAFTARPTADELVKSTSPDDLLGAGSNSHAGESTKAPDTTNVQVKGEEPKENSRPLTDTRMEIEALKTESHQLRIEIEETLALYEAKKENQALKWKKLALARAPMPKQHLGDPHQTYVTEAIPAAELVGSGRYGYEGRTLAEYSSAPNLPGTKPPPLNTGKRRISEPTRENNEQHFSGPEPPNQWSNTPWDSPVSGFSPAVHASSLSPVHYCPQCKRQLPDDSRKESRASKSSSDQSPANYQQRQMRMQVRQYRQAPGQRGSVSSSGASASPAPSRQLSDLFEHSRVQGSHYQPTLASAIPNTSPYDRVASQGNGGSGSALEELYSPPSSPSSPAQHNMPSYSQYEQGDHHIPSQQHSDQMSCDSCGSASGPASRGLTGSCEVPKGVAQGQLLSLHGTAPLGGSNPDVRRKKGVAKKEGSEPSRTQSEELLDKKSSEKRRGRLRLKDLIPSRKK